MKFLLLALFLIVGNGAAFMPSLASCKGSFASTISMAALENGLDGAAPLEDRRDIFKAGVAASSLGFLSLIPDLSYAEEMIPDMGTKEHPIVVLGAGGKVGKLCTEILNDKKLYTRACTRSGRDVLGSPSQYVSYAAGDVTNYDQLKEAFKGASGVIFAATASGKKKGGDPAHVDYAGLYNTAKACLVCEVPKLAVVSSGCVTRPESAGFKATNFFVKYVYGDKIMDYKIAGETAMRDLYAVSPNKNLAYTVVRPGGLIDKPSVGSSALHVSQGDVYSAEVPREDVARATVAAVLSKKTDFTTFELNQIEGLGKAEGKLPDLPGQLVHSGASSFDGLFDGLVADDAMKKTYGNIISGFKGSGIEPVEKLA